MLQMKKQAAVKEISNPISRNTPEKLRYFYHPDHIGSTSWVTDSAKNGIQYCEYLPAKKLRFFSSLAFGNEKLVFHYAHCLRRVGEPFLEKRSTTWNSRYTFSGKERDGETGYSYFGARYYNSDISIWLSVDPLSDKYPNLTAYAYCANNPVKLVDPNGEFPISVHAQMVNIAISGTSYYYTPIRSQILRGTGVVADIVNMSNAIVHMDNMRGYDNIKTAFNNVKNSFSEYMQNGNYEKAGVSLHTIADFYAHSNYIPLYQEYAESNGKSMDINDIPTFSEAMKDPSLSKFLDEKGLKTGNYGEGPLAYPKDKMSDDPNSHGQMNMDTNGSPNGGTPYNNKNSRYEAAKAVAQKELNKIVDEN